jgi:hypothetical protein
MRVDSASRVTSLDLIEEVVNRDERFLGQGEEVLAKIRETAHQMTGRVARALRAYRAADRGGAASVSHLAPRTNRLAARSGG